jgi:hypothetical protein
MEDLATIYYGLEKYADAEKLQIHGDARKTLLREDHPVTITAVGNLAQAYYWLEKYVDTEKL